MPWEKDMLVVSSQEGIIYLSSHEDPDKLWSQTNSVRRWFLQSQSPRGAMQNCLRWFGSFRYLPPSNRWASHGYTGYTPLQFNVEPCTWAPGTWRELFWEASFWGSIFLGGERGLFQWNYWQPWSLTYSFADPFPLPQKRSDLCLPNHHVSAFAM